MSKVILVLGATGMIGHNLYLNLIKSFDKANVFFMTSKKKEIIKSYNFYNIKCGFYNANFFNFDELYNNIKFINADFVINCCGITKKKCTSNNEKTIYQINVKLPHYLSSLALKENFKLIHLSSDCVFSGKKGNYEINDTKDAQDLYGISKAKSEITNSNTLILRKSTIGLELSENHGLLEWFLNLDIIAKGYRNAIFNGLTTSELSKLIIYLIKNYPNLFGLYQVGSYNISKFDLLKMISRSISSYKKINIEPYDDFYCNRSLNCSVFNQLTKYNPPTWEKMIEDLRKEIINKYYANV